MSTPHKWASVIHAWADGKAIQYRFIDSANVWHDYSSNGGGSLTFGHGHIEWRIKPAVVRYRVALYRVLESNMTGTVADEEGARYAERLSSFIRWLTDWQEAEVPA